MDTRRTDEERTVMGLVDGEIPPSEVAAAEALLADGALAAWREGLVETAEAHRESVALAVEGADLSGLWDAVSARLEAGAPVDEGDADALLMRWHDGELADPEGVARAEARAGTEAGRAWLESMREVGEEVRASALAAAAELDPEEIPAAVERATGEGRGLSAEVEALLLRYHDGETDAEGTARAEALLAADAGARRHVEELGALGEGLRQWSAAAGPVDLWPGVEAEVRPAPVRGAPDPRPSPPSPAGGLAEAWSRFLSLLRPWAMPVALGAAAALVAALLLDRPDPESVPALAARSPFAGAGTADNGMVIDDIQSDGGVVMVLESDGVQPAIIWIDEPEGSGQEG
ncbi:hypothetical protein L6R50_10720 [Myxococcota bacterium]|nr:hypothetical protein [Myxococcota bacterium]